jgi:hypothetical membrane protein
MKPVRRFARRFPAVGPLVWVLGIVQYFWAQWYVASAWPTAFSYRLNVISDLGSTTCGIRDAVYVCSPLHALMNWSFILIGPALGIGAVLIYANLKPNRITKVSFILLAVSGLCTSIVGYIPEDVAPILHMLIASSLLIIYTVGVGLMHFDQVLPWWLRRFSLEIACLSIVALLLLAVRLPTPLGPGGLERMADYSLDVWICVVGLWLMLQQRSRLEYRKPT